MNLNEAKRILNNNGYFLKEDARRNNTDISDIFSLIDVHDWSPKSVAEEIMKHYYEPITVDYIDETNYKKYIGKYVNVKKDVNLIENYLTKLPIRFGTVGGDFDCSYNSLTSLEGAPEKVGGYFYCGNNNLTSLVGAPKVVGGDFYCDNNKLTTLEGAPKSVGGDFQCYGNEVNFTKDDVLKVSDVKGDIEL